MDKEYREQSAKFDRLQVAHRKLKSQHKDHEATLEKERLRHEVEIEELRMQLRQERQLRENQETRMKSGRTSACNASSLGAPDGGAASSSSSSSAAALPTFNTAITKRQPRRAIVLYTDVDCVFHQTPTSHPEKAGRVSSLWEQLYAAFDQKLDWCSNAPRAAIKSLLLVHSPKYVTKS